MNGEKGQEEEKGRGSEREVGKGIRGGESEEGSRKGMARGGNEEGSRKEDKGKEICG